MNDTSKNIVLIAASALVTLVLGAAAAEMVLKHNHERWRENYASSGSWLAGLATVSPNPKLMWEYRRDATTDDPGLPVIQTNEYGFREGRQIPKAKPDEEFRISFLGDSVTLGYGVAEQDSFVTRVEQLAQLQRSGQRIRTLNFGIDGYNTEQLLELLTTRVLEFETDRVVYVMCLNDFDFDDSSGLKRRYFRDPDSFLLEKLRPVFRELLGLEFHEWYFKKNNTLVFQHIRLMQQLLAEKGIDFEVVVLPVFHGELESFNDYPLVDMHRNIMRFLAGVGIRTHDLLPTFVNQDEPPNAFAKSIWHPNKRGHDLIARQLAPLVTRPRKTGIARQSQPTADRVTRSVARTLR